MTVIGITGGTGAGKTTALRVLETFGAKIMDCDKLYHEMLEKSPELVNSIAKEFPNTVKDGKLDRKALGLQVFADSEKLKRLNEITDHCMFKKVRHIIEENEKLMAVDAIRLIESGLDELCDITIGITAPKEKRISRIMNREGIDREYALLRIEAQQPEEFYFQNCDSVLMNDYETKEIFEEKCTIFFKNLLRR